jgi:multidrug efflux pump subunit AcrA (membrane-fusion protein)
MAPKSALRKYRFVALALVVVFILAGLLLARTRATKKELGRLSEPLRRGTIVERVYGIGTVTARNIYRMKVGVTSVLRQLFVAEGDVVKRGQKLVAFEDSGVRTAPFDGTVTYLPVKAGESVFAQALVLTLVDLTDRYVVVSLEQRAAVRVRQGQTAKLSFENMRENAFEGVVQSLYSNENNFLVRINVNDLPPQLLPGMTADVAITINEHPNALVVPTAAIDVGKVYVQRGVGSPTTIAIRSGIVDGTMAEVLEGDLKEGDRIYLRERVGP